MKIFLVKELRVPGINYLTLKGQDAPDKNTLLRHLLYAYIVKKWDRNSFLSNSFQRHLFYCYQVIHFACEFIESIFEVFG